MLSLFPDLNVCLKAEKLGTDVVATYLTRASEAAGALQRCSRISRQRLHSTNRLFTTSAQRRADPWPLPHTPEHLESTKSPTDIAPPTPLARPNETLDTMRARLVYQSRKRGTLESDLLLSTFARDQLGEMSEAEMREFDKLLDEPDWDIYYWATGKRTPPERWTNSEILKKLAVHARNEGKVVRSMPAL